jgi:hypothetical protein
MGAVAVFDYGLWSTRYPEFSNVSATLAEMFWNEATIYHSNDGTGPVTNATMQLTLLNMLAAHIAMLSAGTATQPASGLVGRISSATQGSVSVSTDLAGAPGTSIWFSQTAYGLSYYQMTAVFRSMHYRTGPRRYFGVGRLW